MKLQKHIPVLEWLPKYRKEYLRPDFIAGLTVWVMLVPQGMAYALLAGLQPIYGLYASIIPLMLYAFFGSSRHLSVGPVALVSLLILTGVGEFADPGSSLFISLAITTALLAGLIQIMLGVFRLGFLINFLSHPVISGFTSAAALIIGFSQLRNLLGIDVPRSNHIHEVVEHIVRHISEIHFPTLFIGAGGIVLILLFKKIHRSLPAALLTVVISIVVVWLAGLDGKGVEIVGEVPKGLPAFSVPRVDMESFQNLLPLALTICLISFIESLAISKTIESKHKSYRVIPNQELIALGLTKIGGSFFQSYPTTGSFIRSAVNDESGAKTGISSIISALLIALTLLFLTPMFYYLPKAILASIIIVAVANLINYQEAVNLWKNHRQDFLTLMATFIITLTLGIQDGVLSGVILSLAIMVFRNSKPHIAVLGKLPKSSHYRSINRFEDAKEKKKILIVRFDAQLYFANAEYFRETIEEMVEKRGDKLEALILDASSIHDIDSSAIHIFDDVIDFLNTRKVKLYITGVIGPVRDVFYKSGLMDKIGKQNQFMTIQAARDYHISKANGSSGEWTSNAIQTNVNKKAEEE